MKKLHRALLAATAILVLNSASVLAADLNNGSIKDDGGYVPQTSSRPALFYVRGDFTASHNDFGSLSEAPNYNFFGAGIGNSRAWGGGLGMYFSPSVRGDLTVDWGNAASVSGSANNSLGSAQGQFGVKHLVGLANLYYDFDTRTRFTPYLGVGLGFARNTTTAGDGSAICTACGSPPATATIVTDGATKTNAAGALMAGFSAKLVDRVSLDAGSRFLYTGDARTSDMAVTYSPAAPSAPATLPKMSVNDMYAHQFRVGLRVDLR